MIVGLPWFETRRDGNKLEYFWRLDSREKLAGSAPGGRWFLMQLDRVVNTLTISISNVGDKVYPNVTTPEQADQLFLQFCKERGVEVDLL